jgi:anti-sigma B factor antagonist
MSAEPTEFAVLSERESEIHTVTVRGELDLAVTHELETALDADAEGAGAVLLDLTELAFMDSAGLRVLLMASERYRQADTPWAVAIGEDSAVRRMLSLSETEAALPVFPDRESAASSLSERATE